MHIPVLLREVIEYLEPKPDQNFIDCTIDGGGHSLAILERIEKGKILGIDWDEQLLLELKFKIRKENLILVCDNFANLKDIVKKYNFRPVNGILFDLGISSWHLEKSKRGFSFLKDELLDMRYSSNASLKAEDIINRWSVQNLERIFKEYGEERYAEKIARQIVVTRTIRPIRRTLELVEAIRKAIPKRAQFGRLHFATKIFQALRIAVNNELDNLNKALTQAVEILEPNGRLVIISFHSLEDRLVKIFFKEKAEENQLKILTKKPIRPSLEEIKRNPRSRSAKLRAAEKLKIKN